MLNDKSYDIQIKIKTNYIENKKIDHIYYSIIDNNIENILEKTDKIVLKFFKEKHKEYRLNNFRISGIHMNNDFYKHFKNNEHFINNQFTKYSRIDLNSPFLFIEEKNAILIHNLYENKQISFIEKNMWIFIVDYFLKIYL